MYTTGIIVVSDRAFRGERPDECLAALRDVLAGNKFEIADSIVVDDEPEHIRTALTSFIEREYQLVFTSGGTGCGYRDHTPEVTRAIVQRLTPGIDEAIRAFSSGQSEFAMYSRSVSGIARRSLIINLPGSPRAVKEIVAFLLPTLSHPLKLIARQLADCNEDIRQ